MKKLLPLAFLAAFFLSYLGAITEGDFFYHLKLGQTIWEIKDIPSGFPSQWLGQVIIYLVWKPFGFNGVVFMRAAVYASLLAFLFIWMRRSGVPLYQCLFFVLLPAHILVSFPSERPQIFSFLLFPLTVYLLELYRRNAKAKAIWLLLLIIPLWANIHGGFTIGVVAVWIYFIPAVISFFRGKMPLKALLPIGIVATAPGIALVIYGGLSFVPHVVGAVISIINPNPYVKSVYEYLSPLEAAIDFKEIYPSYWIFLLVIIFTLIKDIRRMPLEHIVLFIFFGLLPFKGLRFMPFFNMLAPLAASYYIARKEGWENSKLLFAGFCLVLVLWLIFIPSKNWMTKNWLGISGEFPAGAVNFMEKTMPEGNIFNYYGWGGFILWALPDRQIFMPAANIPEDVDKAYEEILWAKDDMGGLGSPQWRALLDAYKLDIIIMPGISPVSGQIYPIVDALQNDREWFLIYSDEVSNILVRATAQNREVIRLCSLPKANIYLQIIVGAKRHLRNKPDDAMLWRSLAQAYIRVGYIKEAEEAYKKAR